MKSAKAFYTEEIIAGRYEVEHVWHISRGLPVDIYSFTLKAAEYPGVNDVTLRVGQWGNGVERCLLVLRYATGGLKSFTLPPVLTLAQAERMAEDFWQKQ